MEVLKRPNKRVARICPKIANTWVLHHENVSIYASLLVREFLAKQTVATLPKPSYSPDLAPPDLICFPGSNPAWKETILGLLKTCRQPWWMLWKRSQFKTSREATTRSRTAGNGVLMLNDVILKNRKCL
jgi:hypothetical protein